MMRFADVDQAIAEAVAQCGARGTRWILSKDFPQGEMYEIVADDRQVGNVDGWLAVTVDGDFIGGTRHEIFDTTDGEAIDFDAKLMKLIASARKRRASRARAASSRKDRHNVYRDLGMRRVKGALGGTYYE